MRFFLEATSGFGPEDNGFADRGLTTWLCRRITFYFVICLDMTMGKHFHVCPSDGADYGARTRHLDLGKVALYQMS